MMGNGFPWLPGRQLWIKKISGIEKAPFGAKYKCDVYLIIYVISVAR